MTNATVCHDLSLVAPILVLSAGAFLLLLLEVFLKGTWSRSFVTGVTLLVGIGSAIYYATRYEATRTVFSGMMYSDQFALFVSVLIMLGAILSVLLVVNRVFASGIESESEYYALLLMSTAGAMIFANAAELITLFLGLETMSMALYCLCGAAISRRESSESALKYFLLGSFSSAFLLYGIALLYGLTGETSIALVAQGLYNSQSPILYFAVGLMLVGLVFKLGAVPFHFWAPDVYEGAPTAVTAFMACVIKASAVAASIRVLWMLFPSLLPVWSGAVWFIAAVTMIAGNLLALRQRSVKRMLAYSSIAHAGYIIVALLAPNTSFGGGAAILFYLVGYTAMTMGAFGVVLAVSGGSGGSRSDDITRFNGLGKSRPFLAAMMALFMFSLAGLPPGMVGLLGKFYIFNAAIKAGYVGLSVIGVIGSAISCYYYLRVIVAMYFVEGEEGVGIPSQDLSLNGALLLCAIAVVLLGIFPSSVYDAASSIMALM